jgi:hypothetical protein
MPRMLIRYLNEVYDRAGSFYGGLGVTVLLWAADSSGWFPGWHPKPWMYIAAIAVGLSVAQYRAWSHEAAKNDKSNGAETTAPGLQSPLVRAGLELVDQGHLHAKVLGEQVYLWKFKVRILRPARAIMFTCDAPLHHVMARLEGSAGANCYGRQPSPGMAEIVFDSPDKLLGAFLYTEISSATPLRLREIAITFPTA